MSGWRPALRIARRSVRRNLKRSILVAALIAVPIAGATVVDGLIRTMTGSDYHRARFLGNADGLVNVTDRTTLGEWRPGDIPADDRGSQRDPASVDVLGLLPPGSRTVDAPVPNGLRLREGERIVRTELSLFDVGDPLTDHNGRLVSGRSPEGPGEAVITRPLAERLGLLDGDEIRQGATITADDGPTVTVTGVAVHPFMTGQQAVIAPPGSTLLDAPTTTKPEPMRQRSLYLDLPPDTDVDEVWPVLAANGVEFQQGSYYGGSLVTRAAPVALVVGFGLLEVVLLAGASFAVGARRQVRELGLVGANGGTTGHVRRIVLAQGLFLGVVGTMSGLVLGWVLLTAGKPVWEGLTDTLIDSWRFGPVELALAITVGVGSGLGAALLPAIGVARMRPVDALAQRFRNSTGRVRLPVLGVVLLGMGIVGVIAFGWWGRQKAVEFSNALRSTTLTTYPTYDLTYPIIGVMVTGIVAVVGMFMVSPGLVALLGRIGSRLPLSSRLALRDAGRHRHRTVPAVMAIMVVVAGSVTMAFTVAGHDKEVRTVPDNTIVMTEDPGVARDEAATRLRAATADVVAELPGAVANEVRTVDDPGGGPDVTTPIWLRSSEKNVACQYNQDLLAVGTPGLIELITGRGPSASALSALADGKVLVTDKCLITDGMATLTKNEPGEERKRLPAQYLPMAESDVPTSYYDLPGAFISSEAATAHGLTAQVAAITVTHKETATQDEVDAALAAVEDNGLASRVETEENPGVDLVALALAAGAGLVTLLGVGITVTLSAAEGRADLATLAAIGAQPRRRRTLAGAQALVLSSLGTVLGLVFGGVFGVAVVWLTGQTRILLPWESLAVTVAVVPLLAVAIAMATTRSNLPMVRRLE